MHGQLQHPAAWFAGKANQGPGKRSLPGRPTKAPARGACREGHSRHTKKACRDAPRIPARPGERQASGPDKTMAAARRLPWQATTLYPRSSTSTNVSPWVLPGARGERLCSQGYAVASGDEEKAIVANGGAPNGHFLHCLGNSDGHSMTLSPAVRVR